MPHRAVTRLVLAAGAALLVVGPAADTSAGSGTDTVAETASVTVMTQNLYLGADVGIALDLVPDVAAAAASLWSQVAATDFPARAPALARDVASVDPIVIGLQEATTWNCTPDEATEPVAVFDFTADYLAATAATGTGYVIAEHDGQQAFSAGYTIEPLIGVSVVNDPELFGPLFGTDQASCGFQIADALLVRADLADRVTAVGTGTYEAVLEVIPGLITVQRGYAWADIDIEGTTVRFVTTHLESVWAPDSVPNSVLQAGQLVDALSTVSGPLVVMGDFNADPRDPRPVGAPNPAGQPEASDACNDRSCNAYWVMVDSGFTDAGPDPTDPANYSWGSSALLAGPDPARLPAALEAGNRAGYTDRLDYVFVRNGVDVVSAALLGNTWPEGPSIWDCDDPEQVAATIAQASALGAPVPDGGRCLASDHAAVTVELSIAVPLAPDATDDQSTDQSSDESTDESSDGSAEPAESPAPATDGSGTADNGSPARVWLLAVAALVAAAAAGVVVVRRRRG